MQGCKRLALWRTGFQGTPQLVLAETSAGSLFRQARSRGPATQTCKIKEGCLEDLGTDLGSLPKGKFPPSLYLSLPPHQPAQEALMQGWRGEWISPFSFPSPSFHQPAKGKPTYSLGCIFKYWECFDPANQKDD
jgi:hypothetical protein